jgi:hypothetical protein
MQQIRSELDAAQKTIADGRDMNDKLTAELADNTEHRTSLEAQLAKADETRQSEVRKLGDELAILKLKLDDYEHKLSDKDAALKALLSEFATKPKKPAVPSDERPDSGVHRLPRRTGAHDETGAPDRDRVTRLLVGTIDGQKLRFPLFKDKLTIGRTAHNDIQIKAQFISRRHAVIVTEDEQTKIVDWGSKNGIYVNGQRVTETALRSGDLVTVGTAEFVFEERPKR